MNLPAQLRDKSLVYDLAARVALAAWFGWHGGKIAVLVVPWVWTHDVTLLGTPDLVTLAARSFQSLFMLSVAVAVLIRHRATLSLPGLYPRVLAIGGTFALAVLPALPGRAPSETLDLVSDTLMLCGCLISLVALLWLGRSFSLVPQARRLITTGPYRLVRHPIYLAEFVFAAGFVLQYRPWPAWVVFALLCAMQLERIRLEEQVLRDAFPEYSAYAGRTPMLLPWPRRSISRRVVPGA
ncbi:MAG TPA: isoprenylcysteine carboxylmethyltransferase family protein [Myxococcota bacterium]|nr:isoprenylcysteine carboxylmethyltransferase family protein [Myxococcota bacterium]